jgi:hypothetical protein
MGQYRSVPYIPLMHGTCAANVLAYNTAAVLKRQHMQPTNSPLYEYICMVLVARNKREVKVRVARPTGAHTGPMRAPRALHLLPPRATWPHLPSLHTTGAPQPTPQGTGAPPNRQGHHALTQPHQRWAASLYFARIPRNVSPFQCVDRTCSQGVVFREIRPVKEHA